MFVLTMSCAASKDGGGKRGERHHEQDAGIVVLRSLREAWMLAQEALDPKRDYPIVCLTLRVLEHKPSLPPMEVRRIVGSGVPIYVIASDHGIQYLSELLPEHLDVSNGETRIWTPGLSENSDLEDHPLVRNTRDHRHRPELLRSFAHAWRSIECPKLTVEQRLRLAERQGSAARDRVIRLERQLRRARSELTGAAGRAMMAEDRLQITSRLLRWHAKHGQRETWPSREGNLEVELYFLVCSAWLELTPEEREKNPLHGPVFASQFVRMLPEPVEQSVGPALSNIAQACAMIACDLASERLKSKPRPVLADRAGPQVVRPEDGAKLWRCALERSASVPCLHYWIRPDGMIEFSAVERQGRTTNQPAR
jgi:hypothetical protein